ncbi:MAG: alcohol dehydrogenase catalytic domain-containing protein, partial [Lentisphaerae bacterium]|nr:alcohol dehydrogenase catalytic domain-containing protein [Lentisphaerota bacterium]
MKAAVIKEPGRIVVEEVAIPVPDAGEVLLKVDACALCGTDQRVLKGEKHVDVPIVGHEIAGTVAAVGTDVKGVELDERYAVQTVIGCNACPMCALERQNLCENGFKAIGYQWNGG